MKNKENKKEIVIGLSLAILLLAGLTIFTVNWIKDMKKAELIYATEFIQKACERYYYIKGYAQKEAFPVGEKIKNLTKPIYTIKEIFTLKGSEVKIVPVKENVNKDNLYYIDIRKLADVNVNIDKKDIKNFVIDVKTGAVYILDPGYSC